MFLSRALAIVFLLRPHVYVKTLFLIGLLALSSCTRAPALSPLHTGDVVLAFGDSLTVGYGVAPEHSYPAVLAKQTGLTVINAGVSGETTERGLIRFERLLNKHQPKLLILLEGGNDILRNYDLATTKQNLASMIETAQARAIEVVLISVPEKKLFSGSADFYADLADQYQLPLEDDIVTSLMRRPSMKSDYVHFNKAGYTELAMAIKTLLIESGAISEQPLAHVN